MKTRSSRRWLGRVLAVCFVLLLLTFGAVIASSWHCGLEGQIPPPAPQPAERKAATAGVRDYSRPEEDSYLSYPEWYIVWSYQEKADFQEQHLPSGFPYLGAVRQYWQSCSCISHLLRGKYPWNGGEQLMLMVIGTSFSMEYLLKGIYENAIGRLSEWSSGYQAVDEDRYADEVAREYADFVHIRPFYEFRFARHVGGLWSRTSFWGAHLPRKWERKAFLTVDYTAESFYCWLIEKATHWTYGEEPVSTYAWISNADSALWPELPRMKMVKQTGPREFIVDIPRYQEFTATALVLAERRVRFVEIAGNSRIIVSVLAPQSWHYGDSQAPELFSTPVLTHPGMKRAVIGCEAGWLNAVVQELRAEGVSVEHVYDY